MTKSKIVISSSIISILVALLFFDFNCRNQPKYHSPNKDNFSEEVYYDSVCKYMVNLLGKKKLKQKAAKFGIGGYINIDYVTNWDSTANSIDVLNLFPCFDYSFFGSEFYVGYNKSIFDSTDTCGCHYSPMLKRSGGEFKYEYENASTDDVSAFLNSQDTPPPMIDKFPKDIRSDEAEEYGRKFLEEYSDDDDNAYNKSFCAYFTRAEIKKIINQTDSGNSDLPIIGIRYFLGFDHIYKDNKIRMILIGVDNKGKNFVVRKSDRKRAVMMEKAWPPDNCSTNK